MKNRKEQVRHRGKEKAPDAGTSRGDDGVVYNSLTPQIVTENVPQVNEGIEALVNRLPHFHLVQTPPHTCGQEYGITADISPESTLVQPWKEDNWRECDGCYHRRVDRFAKQVMAEREARPGDVWYILEVEKPEADRLAMRWGKRQGARWKGSPFEKDDDLILYAIIHNQDKEGGGPARRV